MTRDTEHPWVSVVLPVYNGSTYLRAAIDSVLAQTFDRFELIVVDDGSTDESPQIVKTYVERDPRVRLVSRPNTGIVGALNDGLAVARADLIARMDADDIALPQRFAKQVRFLQQHDSVVIVGGAYEVIDEKSRPLTVLSPPQSDDELQPKALAGHTCICHPTVMMRREAVEAVGGYHEPYRDAEDLDLYLRLGERGELANVPDVVLRYRMHAGSVSGQRAASQREVSRRACEAAWERRGIDGTFEATESWRPTDDRASRLAFIMQYGWWAFTSGYRRTALSYAMRAIQTAPLRSDGWRLAACAVAKPCSTTNADLAAT